MRIKAIVFTIINIIFIIILIMLFFNNKHITVYAGNSMMHISENGMINESIQKYIGDNLPGVEMKALMDSVISINKKNENNSGKFVAIEYVNFENTTQLSSSSGIIGTAGEINNNSNYIEKQGEYMQRLKYSVNTAKRYNASAEFSDKGQIIKVIIKEINNNLMYGNNIVEN